jgi:hypothetical protein
MEKIFDRHNMYKEKKEVIKLDDYMEINIGSLGSLKLVKIGKGTTSEERREIENLANKCKDIFTWLYKYLRAYKGDTIQ